MIAKEASWSVFSALVAVPLLYLPIVMLGQSLGEGFTNGRIVLDHDERVNGREMQRQELVGIRSPENPLQDCLEPRSVDVNAEHLEG